MNDIILYLIIFAVGAVVGYKVSEWIQAIIMRMVLEDLGIRNEGDLKQLKTNLIKSLKSTSPEAYQELAAKIEDDHPATPTDVLQIVLEEHNGTIYAYAKEDNQFLAQGRDKASLVDHLSQRVKGMTVEFVNAELLSKYNT